MKRFRIQYAGGPALEIEAEHRELAWDEYKRQTGLRRKPGDEPPAVEELTNHENTEVD